MKIKESENAGVIPLEIDLYFASNNEIIAIAKRWEKRYKQLRAAFKKGVPAEALLVWATDSDQNSHLVKRIHKVGCDNPDFGIEYMDRLSGYLNQLISQKRTQELEEYFNRNLEVVK